MKTGPDLIGRTFTRLTVIRKIVYPGKKCKWECRCSCGKISLVDTGSLIRTDRPTRSCGCLKIELAGTQIRKLPDADAITRRIYNIYKDSAKRRHIVFSLSLNDVKNLIFRDCFYCGDAPSNSHIYNNRKECIKYGGIDRVDNTLGYVLENVVPCCKNCNFIKQSVPIYIAKGMMEFINNDRK